MITYSDVITVTECRARETRDHVSCNRRRNIVRTTDFLVP